MGVTNVAFVQKISSSKKLLKSMGKANDQFFSKDETYSDKFGKPIQSKPKMLGIQQNFDSRYFY